MRYDLVIVGAGPAGLACARRAAQRGLSTLLLERRQQIGRKVCAGGITWNGLADNQLDKLVEKSFTHQEILSRWQKITLTSAKPIIATVNRETLGAEMARQAQAAGATIRLGCRVTAVSKDSLLCSSRSDGRLEKIAFHHLLGADGSSSLVRRFLALPVQRFGMGLHYQLPGDLTRMEWHLDPRLFANGYAWIFPHRETFSLGAYADSRAIGAQRLHRNLLQWSERHGFQLQGVPLAAERISFDYRGCSFGNIFLAGDAAGLASGLTGEGIYPAIVSGEAVADSIGTGLGPGERLSKLLKNHRRHRQLVALSGRFSFAALLLSEGTVLGLRTGLLDWSAAEMAR